MQQVHDDLSSLPPEDAAAIGSVSHRHREIGNKCHHLLDVPYHEDHNQVRDRICAQDLTLLKEISANLLRDDPLKCSIRSKRKRAGLSARFRAEVIAPIFHKPHA